MRVSLSALFLVLSACTDTPSRGDASDTFATDLPSDRNPPDAVSESCPGREITKPACHEEGRVCGQCSDPCNFCETTRCTGGMWRSSSVPVPATCQYRLNPTTEFCGLGIPPAIATAACDDPTAICWQCRDRCAPCSTALFCGEDGLWHTVTAEPWAPECTDAGADDAQDTMDEASTDGGGLDAMD